MTTYAIGDLQGCLEPLQRLLDRLHFDPACDTLWFVGDLINRGPQSLETLRFVKALGNAAITVLGNHDLHLLAVVHGFRKASDKDTLSNIITAPDCEELCDWLAHRPLLHHDKTLGHTLVHAGIHPRWSLKRAIKLARKTERHLQTKRLAVLSEMYGNTPAYWDPKLKGRKRDRFVINVFTRMRFCHADSALDFSFSGSPAQARSHLMPWYRVPGRKPLPTRLIFGHWSGHPAMAANDLMPIDRGCVWGGVLAAYVVERNECVYVPCRADSEQ